MKIKQCKICGASPEAGRRYCKACLSNRRRELNGGKLPRYNYGKSMCVYCGRAIILWRKTSISVCVNCANRPTNANRLAHKSNSSYVTRRKFEKVLNRQLSYNEVVHHIDENNKNNVNSNLLLMRRSDHCKLHNFLRSQRALLAKAGKCIDENCWNPLRAQMTTAWLEMTGANVIKLSEIGQSAAEPLKSEDHEEGSETMYVEAETDNAVACDIVQTTTDKASEN